AGQKIGAIETLQDIVMPKLSGIEATRLIKQTSSSSAVLILTAYSDIKYVLGLLDAGACGYLLKSARGSEIVRAIRSVRSGESVLDPVVTHMLLQRILASGMRDDEGLANGLLTPREIEILRLAANGMSNKDMADALFLSVRTVKAHFTSIFNKMGCGSRTDAIIRGLKGGHITLSETPRDMEGVDEKKV
ncbi:LuxR C-terminal-related transcriptional regulator, partial [Chloroflexota bacterium]